MGIRYEAEQVGRKMPIKCPFRGCPGKLSSAYMLRLHFRDLHPKDFVEIWWEGHVQPEIPPTHPLTGVSNGGRMENTEGLGHHGGLGPSAVILRRRGSVVESQVVPIPWTNLDAGR